MRRLETGNDLPQLGQYVRIRQGRDAGSIALIVAFENERFILLADGHKRPSDAPKKKNINHVEILSAVSPEVQRSLKETGRVTNGKLRHAIATLDQAIQKRVEEGSAIGNGKRGCY
ncbi:RNA-binding protein [Bacillaceae bacterium SIJ1]|uniref:KOW domain-containing RNA-binding protein n=1 Tax=Litoribacterium kuwaitense TaxID=1398745 RepID=UPI0013EDFA14|nr:KOW domain-containing RNA-binding protein [Litoribacterium kuwaitense]NGP45863.1 RNA-binding protein [Litoribacterium kuwaitense]